MAKQWLYTMLRIWIVLLSVSTAIADPVPELETTATVVIQNDSVSSDVHVSAIAKSTALHCREALNQLQCDHQCGNCVSCAIAPPDLAVYSIDTYLAPYDYHKHLVFTDLDQRLKPPRV